MTGDVNTSSAPMKDVTLVYDPHPGTKVLFLDFDGVLHPDTAAYWSPFEQIQGDKLFRWLPVLLKILEEFLQVQVVISSTWRTFFGYDFLKLMEVIPEELRLKVVATTPPPPLMSGRDTKL